MALITEDGAGLANAESYCSVATASAYFTSHDTPEASWADLETSEKEALLRIATEYIEQTYGARWRGYPMTDTQALSWPRGYVERGDFAALTSTSTYLPDDEIPPLLARATAELALRANAAPLTADIGRTTKREKAGPVEVEYFANSREQTSYPVVSDMLSRFLKPRTSGAMRGLIRT